MGATTFSRIAYGKNPDEAYSNAYNDAQSERGHQDGYSGDLNSKDGFVLVNKPENVELSVWIKALREDNLPEALQMPSEEFQKQQEIYDDKRGPALCFEVLDKTQQGDRKKYIFVGWAPE